MNNDAMFDLCSQLEHIRVEHSRIFDMLSIYGEGITECMECLQDCTDGIGKYVALRLDKYQSMLEVISIRIVEAESALQTQIDRGYSLRRGQKQT